MTAYLAHVSRVFRGEPDENVATPCRDVARHPTLSWTPLVFSVALGWFPVFGLGGNGLDRVYHLTLPAIALMTAGCDFVYSVERRAPCAAAPFVETVPASIGCVPLSAACVPSAGTRSTFSTRG
jgi:hypothetical protein